MLPAEQKLPSLPDDEVVARVLAGDVALFEILLRRHNQRLFRAARAVCTDDAEAEDAIQQAWLQVYAHLADFKRSASFITWALRIAVNEAMQRRRRGFRVVNDEEPIMREVSPTADPEASAADRELARVLEQAIDALPEALRPVFVLRELEGLDTRACAEALDLTEDAVKMRLHRAKVALRGAIEEKVGQAARAAFSFEGGRCDRVTAFVMGQISGSLRR